MKVLTTLGSVLALATTVLAVDPVPVGPSFEVEAGGYVGGVRLPDVAGLPTGEFVVVWSQTYRYRTYGRAFASDGTPTSGDVLVGPLNNEGGFRVSLYPRVAANAAGTFVVVWTQDDYYPNPPHSIEARVLDSTATPQGPKFTVGTLRGYNFSATIASRPSGEFVVAWDDAPLGGTGTLDAYGRRLDATGALDGGVFPIKVDATAFEEAPAVATTPADGFVAVWSPDDDPPSMLLGQRFDATDSPVGSEFVVTSDANIGYYPYWGDRHAVASNSSGAFVVAWTADSTKQVMAQRYDAAGMPVGGPLQASQMINAGEPDVVMEDDGSFVVVWSEDFKDGVAGRRFSVADGAFGDQFEVTDVFIDEGPRVASNGPGSFVVTWGGYDTGVFYARVLARRFVLPEVVTIGVRPTKLIVVDKTAIGGGGKVVYVSKDQAAGIAKGAGTDPAAVSARFDVAYDSATGGFVAPAGANDGTTGWGANKPAVAKYANKLASLTPGSSIKVTVLKTGKLIKVVSKGLGDDATLDIVAAGAPVGSVASCYTIDNGGDVFRFGSTWAPGDCSFKVIAGGTGRKLVCKGGAADTTCAAAP